MCPRAGENLTGIHTGADLDLHAALPLELAVELADRAANLDSSTNSPKRIVFVHSRDPEHGHHRIADELLQRAPMTAKHLRNYLKEAKHHPP
jgi:hypothetical protein